MSIKAFDTELPPYRRPALLDSRGSGRGRADGGIVHGVRSLQAQPPQWVKRIEPRTEPTGRCFNRGNPTATPSCSPTTRQTSPPMVGSHRHEAGPQWEENQDTEILKAHFLCGRAVSNGPRLHRLVCPTLPAQRSPPKYFLSVRGTNQNRRTSFYTACGISNHASHTPPSARLSALSPPSTLTHASSLPGTGQRSCANSLKKRALSKPESGPPSYAPD
ncbi:hypothetical protein EDB84DRAFT_611492 [Lactarius hengduanensis]|nr:hypothetical protein EDB84DRAFT_611492 [Lactarius hengduanensis]